MSALFTLAQTGLTANPLTACFGMLLVGGQVVIGLLSATAGVVAWRRPAFATASLLLGVVSCSMAILSLFYDLFGPFENGAPLWITLLSAPAAVGGLFAIWAARRSRVVFYAFAALLAGLVLAGGGKFYLRAARHDALLRAASDGDTARVMRAIAEGADIETRDEYHTTLLSHAVAGGHLDTVKALLEAGADPQPGPRHSGGRGDASTCGDREGAAGLRRRPGSDRHRSTQKLPRDREDARRSGAALHAKAAAQSPGTIALEGPQTATVKSGAREWGGGG